MPKKQIAKRQIEIAELYADLDAKLDADEFAKLDRSAPWITSSIRELVEGGQRPEDIASHILRNRPDRWVKAQTIRDAARHVIREIE